MRKSNLIKVSLVAMPMLFSSAAFAVEKDGSATTLDSLINQVMSLFGADNNMSSASSGGIVILPPPR